MVKLMVKRVIFVGFFMAYEVIQDVNAGLKHCLLLRYKFTRIVS